VISPEGRIYEKPQDVEEARSFIRGHSRSSVAIVNGCALTAIGSGKQVVATEISEVHFRAIPDEGVEQILGNPDVRKRWINAVVMVVIKVDQGIVKYFRGECDMSCVHGRYSSARARSWLRIPLCNPILKRFWALKRRLWE